MRRFVSLLRNRCPGAELRNFAPVLDDLRLVKDPSEIALLRESGRLTAVGVIEAMKSTRPGVMEYELDAVLRYVCLIAGGENAWYGHYEKNDAELADGDLVLVDCAPDYRYYASDIGRMFPVNGRYTVVQRQLYGFMVENRKAFLSLLCLGENDEDIPIEAANRMRRIADSTNWEKPIYEEAARRAIEFPHHLSHPVGLAVHDVGHYRGKTLEPGIVLTVEPHMRVPEERRLSSWTT